MMIDLYVVHKNNVRNGGEVKGNTLKGCQTEHPKDLSPPGIEPGLSAWSFSIAIEILRNLRPWNNETLEPK